MMDLDFKSFSLSFIVRDNRSAEVSNFASNHLNPISQKSTDFQNFTLHLGKYIKSRTDNPKLEKHQG